MNEIEKLKELIEKVYHCKYTGDIFYSATNNIYSVTLLFNESDRGLVINGEFTSFSAFCTFFEKELLKRNLPVASYIKVTPVPNITEYIDGTK